MADGLQCPISIVNKVSWGITEETEDPEGNFEVIGRRCAAQRGCSARRNQCPRNFDIMSILIGTQGELLRKSVRKTEGITLVGTMEPRSLAMEFIWCPRF